MAACERCWADAATRVAGDPSKSQTEHYADLLEERREWPYDEAQQCYPPPLTPKKDEYAE